jgi:hypothetical protein
MGGSSITRSTTVFTESSIKIRPGWHNVVRDHAYTTYRLCYRSYNPDLLGRQMAWRLLGKSDWTIYEPYKKALTFFGWWKQDQSSETAANQHWSKMKIDNSSNDVWLLYQTTLESFSVFYVMGSEVNIQNRWIAGYILLSPMELWQLKQHDYWGFAPPALPGYTEFTSITE